MPIMQNKLTIVLFLSLEGSLWEPLQLVLTLMGYYARQKRARGDRWRDIGGRGPGGRKPQLVGGMVTIR